MTSHPSISDLHLFDLKGAHARLTLLRDSDHLLRRFGTLELRALNGSEKDEGAMHPVADLFCFVVDGAVTVKLTDARERSPSKGVEMEITLDADHPQGLLIPFGVYHAFSAAKAARLLLLRTHSDGDAS